MEKRLALRLNIVLLILLVAALIFSQTKIILIAVGIFGTLFVAIDAVRAIIKRKISVDLLAAIALFASLIQGEWTSVVFINLMITSARIFGLYTEGVAGSAIKSLLKLRPEKVKIKDGDEIRVVHVSQVKLNDLVIVEAGDRFAVDGIVTEGEGEIDQSSLTGESIPVPKSKGDRVLSSTLNVSGSFIVKVDRVGKDTTFEKIIDLIEKAQEGKVQIETMGQRFASWYVVISLVGATLIYLFSRNLALVLSVLLVVCADDIAVAVPMAFWAGVGYAAKRGIIIKGTDILEGITKIKTLVVDKTGTLTKGKIKVTGIDGFDGISPHKLLEYVAEAESISEHPIARAIVAYAKEQGIKIDSPKDFKEIPGKGIEVRRGQEKLFVGRLGFVKDQGVLITKSQDEEIKSVFAGGQNLVVAAIGKKLIGIIMFEDEIRPKVKETLDYLRKMGVEKIYMLTGDNESVAAKIAKESGIVDYKAGLLPDQKLTFVKEHLKGDGKLAMVGDGVNDAASLAQADIGIAMGAIGSDAAIESADIALMNDDFTKIKEAVSLGNYVSRIARQNFMIWGVVNVIGLGLVFGGVIGPSGAAAYNFATDFIPIFNSLRVLRYKLIPGLRVS